MGLDTGTERLLNSWRQLAGSLPTIKSRLICVLQKVGIATETQMTDYLLWAARQGVGEICFKRTLCFVDARIGLPRAPGE